MSAKILGLLEAAGRRGLASSDLRRQADAAAAEGLFSRALDRLEAEGEAVEWNRRWYAVRRTDWVTGVLRRAGRGDAVVRAGARGEATHSVPASNLGGARDGDTVLAKPFRGRGRRSDLPPASVVKVLRRAVEGGIVGTLVEDRRGGWALQPFDTRADLEVVVEDVGGAAAGELVVVEVRPSRGGAWRGTVTERLGGPDEPGVDVTAVLRHFGIPVSFGADAMEEARRLPENPDADEIATREDFRDRRTITIDGATSRDFDDAISVTRRAGGFELRVHIADVAHYVPEGSALDAEAYERGTSVYYPERVVPMFPEVLSNGLCSLNPEVDRLVLSAILDFDSRGELVARRFAEGVIRSDRRMTYDEVRRLLEEPEPGDPAEYGDVLEMLQTCRELMAKRLRLREARGSIDFDLPEGSVILDEKGFTVGVRPGERHVAHRIIEEFMIAANEAVGAELLAWDAEALYRVHERPDIDRLEELREALRPLAMELPDDLTVLHPSALQEVLHKVAGDPAEPFVSSLVLRAMQRAHYHPECRGHYALASNTYTHFTSPIRRYPDLVVHRALRRVLRGSEPAPDLAARLPGIATHTSATERRAERSERELLRWKLVRFLAGRVGDRFPARISGVQPFGLFVQLDDWFVDGLVPIASMADDFYVFDAESHVLEGRDHGRAFRLADAVEVELTEADPVRRMLTLKIAEMPEPRRPRRRRGRW